MANNKRDYYEVLGVSRDASQDEIRKAYRKLAKENHPDRHPGDSSYTELFKEINEAYKILSDEQSRRLYDRYGRAAFDPNGGFNPGEWGDFTDIIDIFGGMFGGGFGGRSRRPTNPNAPRKGSDVHTSVTLTFEEAAFGCEKKAQVPIFEKCSDCGGTGAAPGTNAESCPDCRGTGQVITQQRTLFGMAQSVDACPKCRGTGKYIPTPCKTCHGVGSVRKTQTLDVTIPAGVDDNMTIPLRGKGNPGANGGPAGDVYVNIIVQPSPIFERDNTSVFLTQNISFPEAALGAEIQVPTIDGKVKLTIPEGTPTGTTFRLRGKGIPVLNGNGERGNEYVTVQIEVPKHMNAEQKSKLREYAQSMENTSTLKSRLFGSKK